MEKMSMASSGVKWYGLYATLTDFHLCYARRLDMKSNHSVHWMHTRKLPTSETELQALFQRFDEDGKGTLDEEEAKKCLVELNLYSNERDVQILFDALDTDGSGTLTWEEFKDLMRKAFAASHVVDYIPLVEIVDVKAEVKKVRRTLLESRWRVSSCMDELETLSKTKLTLQQREEANKVFARFDEDCDGNLDRNEFRLAMTTILGRQMTEEELKIFWGEFDKNGDGLISKYEFRNLHAQASGSGGEIEQVLGTEVVESNSMSSQFLDTLQSFGTSKCLVPEHVPKGNEVHIIITTIQGGHNSGRTYIHRVPKSMTKAWLESLTSTTEKAKETAFQKELELKYGHSKYSMACAKSHILYHSEGFQMLTAFFILCAFALDICEAQLLPAKGSRDFETIFILDTIITVLFTLELMLNVFAHSNNGFEQFYSKGANWFDAAIVIISIANVMMTLSGAELPNAKLLRLLRLGRAVKLFKNLKSLNRLINAVSCAVLPVCNAFLILFIVAAIFAILGTNFLGEKAPEHFQKFNDSLFTMFQVLSGDGWSDLARSLFHESDKSGVRRMSETERGRARDTDSSVALFFVLYMLINSIMLLNVVVAILLDEFVARVTREKEEEERERQEELDKQKLKGCLDPLTKELITFDDNDDLKMKIDTIYGKLDADGSGGLDFAEFQ